MYKIILKYSLNKGENINTIVLDYFDKDHAEQQIAILKDRFVGMGYKIYSLKLFKTEQINVSEQI